MTLCGAICDGYSPATYTVTLVAATLKMDFKPSELVNKLANNERSSAEGHRVVEVTGTALEHARAYNKVESTNTISLQIIVWNRDSTVFQKPTSLDSVPKT